MSFNNPSEEDLENLRSELNETERRSNSRTQPETHRRAEYLEENHGVEYNDAFEYLNTYRCWQGELEGSEDYLERFNYSAEKASQSLEDIV